MLDNTYEARLGALIVNRKKSMSRKGNCLDNAPVESFFATLKKELIYTLGCAGSAEIAQIPLLKFGERAFLRRGYSDV
jgi:transposase InsO family protein